MGVTPNAVKWVGTEEPATLRGPTWSTGTTRQGDPDDSKNFVPAGCDTVMLTPHHWFEGPPSKVRSLQSLVDAYHASVGSNCVLELGMAVDKTGRVPEAQVARAQEFGKWVRDCYGTPLGSASSSAPGATLLTISLPKPLAIDRVSIMEDLRFGQLVRSYTVSVQVSGNSTWQPFSRGSAVGHKRIDLLGHPAVMATAVRLNVTASVAPPRIRRLAAFGPC